METVQVHNVGLDEFRQILREDIRTELAPLLSLISKEPELPLRLTRKQVAEFLQISLVSLNEWSKPKDDRPALLTPIKIGSLIRYDREAVLTLAKSQPKYRRR